MATQEQPDPIHRLTELGREYRHLREEHDREAAHGASRRQLEGEMKRLIARFERLLEHWVHDAALQDAWRAYFHHGADRPDEPRLSAPPLYRGRTEAGAVIEIQPASDGGYDLLVDGARVEHHEIPWDLEPELIDPIQLGEHTCNETFSASDEAVAALRTFHEQSRTSPPWAFACELYEDGLVDADFALTPRGVRRLARGEGPRATEGERANFCVVLANAARARILTLESAVPQGRPTSATLNEVADVRNPESRARDSEQFSDTRPGLRREGPHGPRHGVSDRRDAHRDEAVRRFVERIADEAAGVWSRFRTCTIILVAGPRALGVLRPAVARRLHGKTPYEVAELPRDLSNLAAPAVHDALAGADVLPPPERLPPINPVRTPNNPTPSR